MNYYKAYGIYRIINTVNHKIYIGKTMNNFGDRWDCHKTMLRKGYHYNIELQADWDKYGENSFRFEIVKECKCDTQMLNELEKNEIKKIKSLGLAYNVSDGGDTPLLGKHLSDEAKKKIGEQNKNNMLGRQHSLETKNKMSVSQKKRFSNMSVQEKKEYGAIMSQRIKGYKWTDEQKQKIKNNKNGAKYTVETVKRIRDLFENNNMSITEISKLLNIPRPAVYNIATYRRWKDV